MIADIVPHLHVQSSLKRKSYAYILLEGTEALIFVLKKKRLRFLCFMRLTKVYSLNHMSILHTKLSNDFI